MKLNLKNDLIVLKLETTELGISDSKIIQITLMKVFTDGRKAEIKSKLINPMKPIPATSTEINGITDAMIQNEQPFNKYAKALLDFIGDCDMLSFNGNRFDIPVLIEEFHTAGLTLDMSKRKTIDTSTILSQMEPRDFKSSYRKFTGKPIEGNVRAERWVKGAYEILIGQLKYYKDKSFIDHDDRLIESPIENDIDKLHIFCRGDLVSLDFAGQIIMKNGVATLNFGKYKNSPVVPTLVNDSNYFDWIMKSHMSSDTKQVIKTLVNEFKNSQVTAGVSALSVEDPNFPF